MFLTMISNSLLDPSNGTVASGLLGPDNILSHHDAVHLVALTLCVSQRSVFIVAADIDTMVAVMAVRGAKYLQRPFPTAEVPMVGTASHTR